MGRIPDLEWVLSHELRLATRYRYFVTVMLVSTSQRRVDIRRLLEDILRQCDEIFDWQGTAAVVMAHTAEEEGLKVVRRCQNRCNGEIDLRYGLVSYPADGATAPVILGRAHECLLEAKRGTHGTVVNAHHYPLMQRRHF